MQHAILEYCKRHALEAPLTQADFVMVVCRSLAERYKKGIEGLNSLLPVPLKKLVIMGGGAKNKLLTELTRQATGLEVAIGPSEATAIGNILMQAQTAGIDISKITV